MAVVWIDDFNIRFVHLRKILSISFLIGFLFTQTEFTQVLKIPFLIGHFLDHHQHGHSHVGVVDFILEHYSGDQHNSNHSEHEHKNLPFKSISHCATNTPVVCARQFEVPMFSFEEFPLKGLNFFTVVSLPDLVIINIWQPPKIM